MISKSFRLEKTNSTVMVFISQERFFLKDGNALKSISI